MSEHRDDEPKHRVRLPGFLVEGEVGLGDVLKQATSRVGIAPCEPCRRRAAKLNRWVRFVGRRRSATAR